ncbi:hypothetical protein AX15_002384 [Amanita polypyramis BW_CC]|nr:hypothetical protein AX15_002384 [Amanita polypyramis BW_CC]
MRCVRRLHARRNPLGVQLLSPALHAQLFPPASPALPPPPPAFVQISRDHLASHGLDPTQASSLPSTTLSLPPLQGRSLPEHFHRIGLFTSEPYRALAQSLARSALPPLPDPAEWNLLQKGWTKYYYKQGGASFSEPVPYPMHDGVPERMLVLDIETMPREGHPYPVIAIAASPNAWYAWISPWILDKSESSPEHFIPLGHPETDRLIVGHNVSFDRARVQDEYSLRGTKTRWLDTMSLHVAVNGISSHQRPAWNKWKKKRERERLQRDEAVEAVVDLISRVREEEEHVENEESLEKLKRVRMDMEDSLRFFPSDTPGADWEDDASGEGVRWESLTSANSLVDVARLHCNIELDEKLGLRNQLVQMTRSQLMPHLFPATDLLPEGDLDQEPKPSLSLQDLLSYCATDVHTTHQIFQSVLPSFFSRCPHPVSFSGVLTMGSSFLTVNAGWEQYLKNAELVYRGMEEGVRKRLSELAGEARLLTGDRVKHDPWLSQLDWTPKKAGKSRGVYTPTTPHDTVIPDDPPWLNTVLANPLSTTSMSRILPLLLRLSYKGKPLRYSSKEGWHYDSTGEISRLPTSRGQKTTQILGVRHAKVLLASGEMKVEVGESAKELALLLSNSGKGQEVEERVRNLAKDVMNKACTDPEVATCDPWYSQLDWSGPKGAEKKDPSPPVYWPKWYWDLAKPKKGVPPGIIDITPRNRIAPLLLKLAWRGYPLYHSREHGWIYRAPSSPDTTHNPLTFSQAADAPLADFILHDGFSFHKLPHKDGEKANVGSPLSKMFVKYAADGTLTSPGGEAKEALELSAVCSYWMSSRDRILNQMVVWEDEKRKLGFEGMVNPQGNDHKWGMILPQVITMGTVTRRAIEKTWLTASNAKKNRVGSELKAMVRAPPGYAIVGADVDSEELWISSCMGDAQFGMHGATALGWMTLEGTKSAGTDLHSKTAKILGLSRDQAKVFNYSRIYGAGMKHAVLLLLQANAGMSIQEAQKLAENLYTSTKGRNTHRQDMFERKFWFGGSESYVFNKLEEIASSERPRTPALGCGVTYALSKEYLPNEFGSDYMPSRINWVVQSSGVDYLHMLIVSMDYLTARYGIQARYLISVHDELRYLVREEDKYRAALALQIANLWTRAMFAYMLGMDNLPQGVAFFSAVDIDRCLRKEVDMECVTPSQPLPISPGESLGIEGVLERTEGGRLGPVMPGVREDEWVGSLEGYEEPNCLTHRANTAAFLRAQATQDSGEVKGLAQQVHGTRFDGGIGGGSGVGAKKKTRGKGKAGGGGARVLVAPVGNGEGFDWSDVVEQLLVRDEDRRRIRS